MRSLVRSLLSPLVGVAVAAGVAVLLGAAGELAPLLLLVAASGLLLGGAQGLAVRAGLHLLPWGLLLLAGGSQAIGVAGCAGTLAAALLAAALAGGAGARRLAGPLGTPLGVLGLAAGVAGWILAAPLELGSVAATALPGLDLARRVAPGALLLVLLAAAGRPLLALLLAPGGLLALGAGRWALGAAGPLDPLAALGAPWLLAAACDAGIALLAARLAVHRGAAAEQAAAAEELALRSALGAALLLLAGAALLEAARPLLLAAAATLGAGAGAAWLLVRPAARLLLRPGPAGSPGARELLGGLYTLLFLVGGGLSLLGRLRRTPEAERERVALGGLGRLMADFVGSLPVGRLRTLAPGPFPTAVYVANHESIYDVPALLALPVPLQILVKEWVWRRAVMGPVVQAAGYHLTDGVEHAALEERARAALARGVSLLVFPEGARSRDGRLARFRNGAFAIARAAGVPVIPVALVHTRDAVRPGGWWTGEHEALIEVLPPLDPAAWTGDMPDRAAAAAARERIRAARDARWLETVETPRWRAILASRWRDRGWLVRLRAWWRLRDPLFPALPRLGWGEGEALVVSPMAEELAARLLQGHPERSVRVFLPDAKRAARTAAILGEPTRATLLAGDARTLEPGSPGVLLLVDALSAFPLADQEPLLRWLAAALAPGGRAIFRDGCASAGARGPNVRPATEWARLLNAAGLAVESTRPELGRRWQVTFVLRRSVTGPAADAAGAGAS